MSSIGCVHILSRGKNKGKPCGKKEYIDGHTSIGVCAQLAEPVGYCKVHTKNKKIEKPINYIQLLHSVDELYNDLKGHLLTFLPYKYKDVLVEVFNKTSGKPKEEIEPFIEKHIYHRNPHNVNVVNYYSGTKWKREEYKVLDGKRVGICRKYYRGQIWDMRTFRRRLDFLVRNYCLYPPSAYDQKIPISIFLEHIGLNISIPNKFEDDPYWANNLYNTIKGMHKKNTIPPINIQVMKEELSYKRGIRHGTYKKWDEWGRITVWVNYLNGMLHGKSISINSHINRRVISNYFKNKEIGEWREYNFDGKLVKVCNWGQNGTAGECRIYHDNGALKEVSLHKCGQRDGPYKEFTNNGTCIVSCYYSMGCLVGQYEDRWDNGTLRKSCYYVLSSNSRHPFDGVYQTWYRNGTPQSKEHYKNGVREGLLSRWHENGHREIEVNYVDGALDGEPKMWDDRGKSIDLIDIDWDELTRKCRRIK